MNVNDLVRRRIADAVRRRTTRKRQREEFERARQYGLSARHAAKLRRLDARQERQP